MRLIDADALMDNIKNKCIMPDWCKTLIRAVVVTLPSVQPERKKGKWIPHPNKELREWDVCTACGTGCKRREYGTNPDGTEYITEFSYLYCPNCGAYMRQKGEQP